MSDLKLKPCPFCGGTDLEFGAILPGRELVTCLTIDCGMHGYYMHHEHWNRRIGVTDESAELVVTRPGKAG